MNGDWDWVPPVGSSRNLNGSSHSSKVKHRNLPDHQHYPDKSGPPVGSQRASCPGRTGTPHRRHLRLSWQLRTEVRMWRRETRRIVSYLDGASDISNVVDVTVGSDGGFANKGKGSKLPMSAPFSFPRRWRACRVDFSRRPLGSDGLAKGPSDLRAH
ncbi:hypothetical protein SLEP1_g47830 [Rubroshorea leprosula]|uniref:Uncharacterized protein n=1 Tax=Rubroshorea leprosula TaxID=152421 RepID=A0AAV5LRU4_9ROSI|nr:hypothetical protein SLEP1_g47830 [Rubroshorea leprosula]